MFAVLVSYLIVPIRYNSVKILSEESIAFESILGRIMPASSVAGYKECSIRREEVSFRIGELKRREGVPRLGVVVERSIRRKEVSFKTFGMKWKIELN